MNLVQLFKHLKSGSMLETVLQSHGLDTINEDIHVFSSKPFSIHSELVFVENVEKRSDFDVNGVAHHYFFDLLLLIDVIEESNKPVHLSKTDKQLAEILLIFADVEE